LTEDLDFCYDRSEQNLARLASGLAPYHPRLRGAPENLPFRFDLQTIRAGLNFTLATDLGSLDFLGEVAGLGTFQVVKNASDRMNIFGLEFSVLSLTGLIRAKRAAGREKDLAALKELEGLLEFRKRTNL